jgi:eukaryotic-like serine/threonine-protein kinase
MLVGPGTRLGPYEIVAPLGAGGMGEVWRARDTRLDRSVAIKIMAAAFASDAAFRQRFDHEARTISHLSHPNICTLHDVGDGYIVMELLSGETLADRMARGPLPLADVLRIGTEIASALSAAHKQGVTHRDLKPANVMLTKSGAKLLDFGLAKDAVIDIGPYDATRQRAVTAEGTIIGTFQYMAPEQLEGGAADARTDIFALGALLYEMATGKRAFEGKTRTSLIAAIVAGQPRPVHELLPLMPAALDHVIASCLAKDSDERWQSAHDVASELRWIGSATNERTSGRRRKSEIAAWSLAALLAVIAVAALYRSSRPVTPDRAMRFTIDPPPNTAFNFAGRDAGPVVVSPDGRRFAFVATSTDGLKRLYVRAIDSVAAQPLTGTDGASYPFWSPDGENLGFFADGKLKRVVANGGAVTTLCEAPTGRGGTWNREGTILFAPSPYDSLYRVPAGGGQPKPATTLVTSTSESSHRWPIFLLDGHHFTYMIFSARLPRVGQTIVLGSLDDRRGTPVANANSQAIYVEPGYLLYVRDGNLVALPFDAKKLRASGDPFPVAEHVQTYPNTGSGIFGASNTGVVAYQPAGSAPVSHLIWYDRHGKTISPVGAPDDYEDPRLSPDGGRVAVTRRDVGTGVSNIWYYDLASNVPTRFSYVPTFDHSPNWSPDGKTIVFDSNRNGPYDVFMKRFGGEEELLYQTPYMDLPTDWSPDGSRIVIQTASPETKWDILSMTVNDRKATPLIRTSANEKEGQVSPDGNWIAYSCDESGHFEVYVSRFPSGAGRWQISSEGGTQPRWRRNGSEIFFLSPERRMMAATIAANGAEFAAGSPQMLFPTRARYTGERSYDVSADGQKFLINTMVFDQGGAPIVAVVNWPALRKAPVQ